MSSVKKIDSILVANRGEIARRVFRTAKSMGISTVAVYSDPDAQARYVLEADRAVPLHGATSAETYLHIDKLLAAAKRCGADAIHPGYGFLSENAEFAQAVIDAGLIWIGPPPSAIAVMGSKLSALERMRAVGVPTLPRTEDPAQAAEVGFPLLVKASAGGGGKGMRIVRSREELTEAVKAARREAIRSFGSDEIYLERYLTRARHIEVQIMADKFGGVRHLFERECSVQRRHQKVVEEAPSPFVDEAMREAMGEAAVAAARSVQYEGAGTVEFVVAETGEFYFLEMNTRLQVEHPVTEMITGLDLVREQILVAQGHPLGTAAVAIDGAAVEVRLYAEDPDAGYLPSSGTVVSWIEPETVRVDAGVGPGDEVTVHYDPMLAKLISHGATRAEAIDRLCHALGQLRVHGLRTNREYLQRVLRHPAFRNGETRTGFLEEHDEDLRTAPSAESVRRATAVAAVVGRFQRLRDRPLEPAIPPGWRNNRDAGERVVFSVAGATHTVEFWAPDLLGAYHCLVDGRRLPLVIHGWDGTWLDVEFDEIRTRISVVYDEDRWWVQSDSAEIELIEEPRFPAPDQEEIPGALVAPMNGTVISVAVEVGQEVMAGQTLVVLEAMKMEHRMTAPADGVVEQVLAVAGGVVSADDLLVVVSARDDSEGESGEQAVPSQPEIG